MSEWDELLNAVEVFFDDEGWDLSKWSPWTPSGLGKYADAHSCTGRVSVMIEVNIEGMLFIQKMDGDQLFSCHLSDPKCFVIAKKVLDGVVDDY